ncbi:MAG: hypothetical protein IJQ82_02445, partial [Selenomonadaceae bacterium]|nr:hypothetical protein [Selenomonadaceae bacterium]
KRDKEKVIKLAGVVEELNERVRRETAKRVRRETTLKTMIDMAKKLLCESEFSLEKIASLCELPLEKVRELAAESSIKN